MNRCDSGTRRQCRWAGRRDVFVIAGGTGIAVLCCDAGDECYGDVCGCGVVSGVPLWGWCIYRVAFVITVRFTQRSRFCSCWHCVYVTENPDVRSSDVETAKFFPLFWSLISNRESFHMNSSYRADWFFYKMAVVSLFF